MTRICMVALALCLLGLAGLAMAQDPYGEGPPYPQNGDPWNYVPQPSGLQFAPGEGNGMPCCGDYNYCWAQGGCARCAHWTQYSWYAPWPYGCAVPYDHPKKHAWLH